MYKTSLVNLILRGITLGSKFILVFFMAKILTPDEVGVYGIFTVTVSIALYFLGMDFYVFNTREILSSDDSNHSILIRNQIVFHAIIYAIIMPILLIIFFLEIIPWEYVSIFYLILILEHISQETNRLLITFSRPIAANLTLFFRSGAWAYAIVLLFLFDNEGIHGLITIWIGWTVGILISIVISLYLLSDLKLHLIFKQPINWVWIKKGFFESLPFFGANIAIKIVEFSDRYFIKYFHGDALVGIYTVYNNIANVVVIFVTSGVILILSPKIIKSFQDGEIDKYRHYMRKLTIGTTVSSIIVGLLTAGGIFIVIDLLDNILYSQYLVSYWIRLLSVVIYSLSLIPHYVLYVRRADRKIIISSLIALFVALIMNLILIPKYNLTGASISVLLSFSVLFIMKTMFALRVNKSSDRIEMR